MVRISLKEAYDDRSVIKKIADLEAKKQDKLTAGQGVTIDGTTISVDTSDLATKAALNAETARLDAKIDDVDAKIPPLASKAELFPMRYQDSMRRSIPEIGISQAGSMHPMSRSRRMPMLSSPSRMSLVLTHCPEPSITEFRKWKAK